MLKPSERDKILDLNQYMKSDRFQTLFMLILNLQSEK